MSAEPRPCSRCGRERDREGQRLCRACHAHYNRAWRALERKRAQWRRNVLKGLQEPNFGRAIDAVPRGTGDSGSEQP